MPGPSLRGSHAEFRFLDGSHVEAKATECLQDRALDGHVCADRVPDRREFLGQSSVAASDDPEEFLAATGGAIGAISG